MSMNSVLLPQNKILFGSDPLVKFHFCTKICVDDLGIFVGNRGYHLEEGSVLRILIPKLATKAY